MNHRFPQAQASPLPLGEAQYEGARSQTNTHRVDFEQLDPTALPKGATSRHRANSGFALVTALIFLVVLTLVAVVAIRSSGLELKMGSNATARAQVLATSELSRGIVTGGSVNGTTTPGGLLDAHVYNRGWPVSIGGSVPNQLFNTTIPTNLKFRTTAAPTSGAPYSYSNSTNPDDWYLFNTEGAGFPCLFGLSINQGATCPSPAPSGSAELVVDAEYADTTTSTYVNVVALSAVYRLFAALASGNGNAMIAGYEGTGRSSAASGGNVFYYVLTRSQDQALGATTQTSYYSTAAQYRYVIRN